MSKAHAIYTLLPNGFTADRRFAKLSLVVSLRVATTDNTLGGLTELLDWPAQARLIDKVQVYVDNNQQPVFATVDKTKVASSDLWKRIFPATTAVDLAGGGQVEDVETAGTSTLYGPVTQTLKAIYAQPADGKNLAGSQLESVLAGLSAWSQGGAASRTSAVANDAVARLLRPEQLTAARVQEAAELLRQQGQTDAAAVVPLIPILQRLRSMPVAADSAAAASIADPNTPPTVPLPLPETDVPTTPTLPGPLDGTRTADRADFHQLLGLIAAQPELAFLFGLRIDLTMPVLAKGEHAIRTTALPWQVVGGRPWSRVYSDPDKGLFTMATQTGAPTEIVNGMLDLRADGPASSRYVVTSMDVVGMTEQLDAMARSALAGGTPVLPGRRDVGITVAQVDRRSTVVQHTIERGKLLSDAFGVPEAVGLAKSSVQAEAVETVGVGADGEEVMYADDVTAGYRVDVRTAGGEWRSLMRRVVTYTIGSTGTTGARPTVLTVEDEGSVDPMVAVQQRNGAGSAYVEIGEDLFAWDGYSLAAPMPGPSVRMEVDGTVRTELPSEQTSPAAPLKLAIVAKPGSLPRLRYGQTYQFRVRAMDLAGNSIDPALADPALVSPTVHYRRQDAVPAPVLVPRKPFTAGESLLRLVVRTNNGAPVGAGSERHVAAPAASPRQAELHGRFDAAMGPAGTPAARDRMLAIGALEAGTFNDARVPDPADPAKRVPAPGAKVAVNVDSPTPPTTTSLDNLPRGGGLPPGEYVVHDTDEALLPYLGDALAKGVAVAGLTKSPVVVPYDGTWPSQKPVRVVVRPGPSLAVTTPRVGTGRTTIDVAVPPAMTVEATLSSTLDDAGLNVLEIDVPTTARKDALNGQVPLITPGQRVKIVHAVQRPLDPLRMIEATAQPRKVGQTTATVTGRFEVHPASTARVDVVASWDETVDTGTGPLQTNAVRTTAGSVTVDTDQRELSWQVEQKLGDTRRRDITYSPTGTTKFREYFPPTTATADLVRTGPGVTAKVQNTSRPEPPVVHSVVPLFAWERKVENGVATSVRRTAGLRVYLERPWGTTGPGERLGVMLYADVESSKTVIAAKKSSIHDKVTRWNSDSLEGFGANPARAMLPADFADAIEVDTAVPTLSVSGKQVRRAVAGHEVRFDPERDQWYADVAIGFDPAVTTYVAMVRLAVVRHQPVSASGCNISSVVLTDPISLPPERRLIATRTSPTSVDVRVTGAWRNNVFFDASVRARGASSSDVLTDTSPGVLSIWLTDPQWEDFISVTGTIPLGGPNASVYRDGKIVVRELHVGDGFGNSTVDPAVNPKAGPYRVEWLDTVDLRALMA